MNISRIDGSLIHQWICKIRAMYLLHNLCKRCPHHSHPIDWYACTHWLAEPLNESHHYFPLAHHDCKIRVHRLHFAWMHRSKIRNHLPHTVAYRLGWQQLNTKTKGNEHIEDKYWEWFEWQDSVLTSNFPLFWSLYLWYDNLIMRSDSAWTLILGNALKNFVASSLGQSSISMCNLSNFCGWKTKNES